MRAKVFLAGRTLARLDRVAHEIAAERGKVEIAEVNALNEEAAAYTRTNFLTSKAVARHMAKRGSA